MKFPHITAAVLGTLITPHPVRDWLFILFITLAASLVLMGISLYFYIGIRSGNIVGAPNTEAGRVPGISRAALDDTVSKYETRRVNYDAGNFAIPSIADPSR